jgi:hypothetical protein
LDLTEWNEDDGEGARERSAGRRAGSAPARVSWRRSCVAERFSCFSLLGDDHGDGAALVETLEVTAGERARERARD